MSDAERVLFKVVSLSKTRKGSTFSGAASLSGASFIEGTGKKAIGTDYINVVTQHALLNERKDNPSNAKATDTQRGTQGPAA
jgi:hypothetical protein